MISSNRFVQKFLVDITDPQFLRNSSQPLHQWILMCQQNRTEKSKGNRKTAGKGMLRRYKYVK